MDFIINLSLFNVLLDENVCLPVNSNNEETSNTLFYWLSYNKSTYHTDTLIEVFVNLL